MDELSWSTVMNTVWEMINEAIAFIPHLIIATIVLIIFAMIARVARSIIRRTTRRSDDDGNLGSALGRLAQGIIILFGFLLAAVIVVPTLSPEDILAGLGVGGIAVGFAFKDILQNFIAGILILLSEPFVRGDQIIFKEYEGTVDQIKTRATTIRTYSGRKIVIPNAELFENVVVVHTGYDMLCLDYDFKIGKDTSISQAKRLILGVLNNGDKILSKPSPQAVVVDLTGSTVNIRAKWWISPMRNSDITASMDWVLDNIYTDFVAAGVDLPFPTQQVLLQDRVEEPEEGSPQEGLHQRIHHDDKETAIKAVHAEGAE